MSSIKRIFCECFSILGIAGVVGASEDGSPGVPYWKPLDSGVTSGMRGVSTVSESVAWTSGTEGTVLKTLDGGDTWIKVVYTVVTNLTMVQQLMSYNEAIF